MKRPKKRDHQYVGVIAFRDGGEVTSGLYNTHAAAWQWVDFNYSEKRTEAIQPMAFRSGWVERRPAE